jgi:glycerol-3-phosphate dehydrogenase
MFLLDAVVRYAMNLTIFHQFNQGLFEPSKMHLDDDEQDDRNNIKIAEGLRYYDHIAEVLQGQISRLAVDGKINYTKLAKVLTNKGYKTRFYKDFSYASARMTVLKLKKEGKLSW